MSRPKYNAKKTECGAGHVHDSGMEATRCTMLTAQEVAGVITHLAQQPVFKVEVNGKLICKYVADHSYRMADSGLPVIEDTKGVQTPAFRLKMKMVQALYPDLVFTVWPVKKRKSRVAGKAKSL